MLRDLTARADAGESLPSWHANGPASRLDLALMLDKGLDDNLRQMARLCLLVA